MSTLSKEQGKQLVKGNNFQSVTDVNSYLKDIFKDIIQELLEAELETKLNPKYLYIFHEHLHLLPLIHREEGLLRNWQSYSETVLHLHYMGDALLADFYKVELQLYES